MLLEMLELPFLVMCRFADEVVRNALETVVA